mgnify:CR=1 FL=1
MGTKHMAAAYDHSLVEEFETKQAMPLHSISSDEQEFFGLASKPVRHDDEDARSTNAKWRGMIRRGRRSLSSRRTAL